MKSVLSPVVCAALVVIGAAASVGVRADDLGTVSFPTSCSADAQKPIERAVALLHSFQYEEAQAGFVSVAEREACAMAHWGVAMSQYHQLWDWPDAAAIGRGADALAKARAIPGVTARERGYLEAADAFFGAPAAASHLDRITAYASRLERLHHDDPQDVDATAFWALARIARAGEMKDSSSELRGAIDVLQPLLARNPRHPGVAHYLIHAADRPELARRGLDAARRYAGIAPDSSHALHMPSHIFSQLGLWQETITTNIRAAAAGEQAARAQRGGANYQLHAMDYLTWAYAQRGQDREARAVLAAIDAVPGADEIMRANNRAYLTARHLVDAHAWSEAAVLPVPNVPEMMNVEVRQARALGLAHRGDAAGARHELDAMRISAKARDDQRRRNGSADATGSGIALDEVEAWIVYAEGQPQRALSILRAAADLEDKTASDGIGPMAREQLGDLLLESKHPSDALVAYQAALKRSPNRFDSLLGAARAAAAGGHRGTAETFYRQLLAITAPDADRPEVAEARTFLGQ